MADHEGQIPLGDDLYIDTAGITVGHYALSEHSKVSGRCAETCDTDELVRYCGSQAVVELCMRNAMQGGGRQEAVIEVEVHCEGPKSRLWGGKKCGAVVQIHEVVIPLDLANQQEPDEPPMPE